MTKAHLIIVGLLVLILAAMVYFLPKEKIMIKDYEMATTTDEVTPFKGFKNTAYLIAGEWVTLVDGVSETSIVSDSELKTITRYFGNEVEVDLNKDGLDDVVFLLTQETGGSGQFFYLVGAVNTNDGYTGSEAVLIGDRIAPQSTVVGEDGTVVVNYAERAVGEPFSTPPSIGKSLRFKFDADKLQFGELVENFEGEAEPAVMTLSMKEWEWLSAVRKVSSDCSCADGFVQSGNSCDPICYFSEPPCLAPSVMCEPREVTETITPKKAGVFKISFATDGKFSVATDCNSQGGSYKAVDGSLQLGEMLSTMMYCEGSQESVFGSLLSTMTSYQFSSQGQLILKNQKGESMVFR